MASTRLLPGFRFHPTDDELIMFYLKRKVTGRLPAEARRAISEVNIRDYSPWELPEKSGLKSRDLQWYFFCPREKKYASGSRSKRATNTGYWKATGNDRTVTSKGRTVGMIKTLVFYQGHQRRGADRGHSTRTNWVIHEFRMEDKDLADAGVAQDAYVLCKVFEKTGSGPKNGSQYGAFREEDWEDEEVCAEPDLSGVSPPLLASCPVTSTGLASTSSFTVVDPSPSIAEPGPSLAKHHTSEVLPGDDIDALFQCISEDTGSLPIESNNNENISSLNQPRSVEIGECNDGDDIYIGLGDLHNLVELGEDRSISGSWSAGHTPNIPILRDETPYVGLVDPHFPLDDNIDTAFLELNDLDMPLDPDCANEIPHLVRDNMYQSYNSLIDVGHSHSGGNTSGGNQYVLGQNVLPAPPEEYIQKVNGIHFDTNTGYNINADESWFTC